MDKTKHWEKIYATRSVSEVGWYAPHLKTSIEWITDINLAPTDPIINVGGGASTLVDDLLGAGQKNITVLDLSENALAISRERLGALSNSVNWMIGDITKVELPPDHFELWHDRAVFHFLLDPEQWKRYKNTLLGALKEGGYFLIGAFGPDAPAKCSGLPVQRYTVDTLTDFFGNEFELNRHRHEIHRTPSGVEQAYVYCLFQRKR
jgi:SAM-dependent methyltransferase